jgi:hypothetical protein
MCKSNYDRWWADNRDKIKPYTLKGDSALRNDVSKYGIDDIEYNRILMAQGGVCAICGGTDPSGRRLCVDHDHKTGEVRGLLCTSCNYTLGAAKDNASVLERMINYLRGDR